jgi:hypothetical protein
LKVDAVLIDDEKGVILCWGMIARQEKKTLRAFRSVEDFLAKHENFDRDQLVYIDSGLGENVPSGEIEAKRISELGFRQIYLTTGHAPRHFPLSRFPWLKGVIGKEAPWLKGFEERLKSDSEFT